MLNSLFLGGGGGEGRRTFSYSAVLDTGSETGKNKTIQVEILCQGQKHL